jgi:hypothetical protein
MTYMQTNKYNNAKVIGRIVVGGNIIPIYDLHSNGHFFVVTILLEIMKEDDLRKSLAFRYNTNWTSVNYGAYFNHQRYESS